MYKKYFICFLVLIISASLFADSLELNKFFTGKDIERLRKGEIITRMYLKNNAVGENTDLKIDIPKTKYANEDFSKYEMITDEKAFFPYKINNEKDLLVIYNILTAYSKLSGMKYYSRLRQKVEDLVLDSYKIKSEKNKIKVSDVVSKEIKEKTVNYFLQKDNKFGKLSFRSELYNDGKNFILINTCLDPISKLVFNICKKEEYKFVTYFIYDEKAGGYYYYSAYIMRIRLKMLLDPDEKYRLFPTTFSNRLRGATVHFAKLLGSNWINKINPWDEDKLADGYYKNY